MVAPPAGLKGDDGIYNYYAQVFPALGPDIPVVYQDYPQATGVYLPPQVFERLVDDFKQLVMLKHEDAPGLAKLTRVREGEKKPGRRRVSILVGNGGLYLPQEMRRGADGAMTGFAWPEMLVQVYELFAAGKAEEAEDLFDIYLPLVRHEVQPAIGLALRKEVLFKRGAIRSPKQRAPGSSLTATDRAELEAMIARWSVASPRRDAGEAGGGVRENGRLRPDRPQRQDRHRGPPDRRRHRRQGRRDRRDRAGHQGQGQRARSMPAASSSCRAASTATPISSSSRASASCAPTISTPAPCRRRSAARRR